MKKKRGVGLVLITDLPEIGRVALLMKRGLYNAEEMRPETWPNACQVTCHGELKGDEEWHEGLFRELCEELGRDFAVAIFYGHGKVAANMQVVSHLVTDCKEMVTYAGFLEDATALKRVRLGPASGGLRPVTQYCRFRVLRPNEKEDGVWDGSAAMFKDELIAVEKAFELFR